MRRRSFVAPNFRCELSPTPAGVADGLKPLERLEHAASEQEVRQRLGPQYPQFTLAIEPYDFDKWLKRAREETLKVVQARNSGADGGYKDTVWGSLKEYLFRLFDDKCAYCEGARAGVTPGAVEHYRPKNGVAGTDHPGYYWLAYDYENYLPTCGPCNSSKGIRFPLRDEASRARAPAPDPFDKAPLRAEAPLLLNAYDDDPFPNELTFEMSWQPGSKTWTPQTVIAKALSERVQTSITVLDLNRESLRNERAIEAGNILKAYAFEMLNMTSDVMNELRAGRRRFSAAGLKAIETFINRKVAAPG
jgi:hypothetical protein